MTDLFLIAHLVRGEPAFDIASQIGEDTSGPIWIIPTSGHRAYPYEFIQLNNVSKLWLDELSSPPPNHPDHYPTSTSTITDISALFTKPKLPAITRRI